MSQAMVYGLTWCRVGSLGGRYSQARADLVVRSDTILVVNILRKEVIQPQVPLRLPCYDLVPIKSFAFGIGEDDFGRSSLSWLDGRCVQGSGTHSPRCC